MHYYKILRHNAGFNEGTSYWEKILARYLAATGGGKIHTTLPITFTSTSWKLAGWTIYGNDEPGENLVPPIGTVNGWKQGYRQKNNGKYASTHNNGEWLYDVYIPIDSTSFTFWATSVSGQASGTFYFFDNNKGYLTNTAIDINNYNNAVISDLPANATYMQFAFRTYCMSEKEIIDNDYQVMLVKGSTAPDHFIPYQKGVGERTKNLFDESDFSLVKVTPTAYRYGTIIGILPQGTYTLTATKAASAQYVYLTKKNGNTYIYEQITNVPYTFTADGVSQYILRIADQNEYDSWAQFGYSKIMLVEGSTAPQTYIPYGYEVPLDIRHKTKNLVDLSNIADSTSAGVTFTVDKTNGTITANRTGTSTVNAAKSFLMTLPAGAYVFSCGDNPQRDVTYDSYLRIGDSSPRTIARDNPDDSPGTEFTLSESTPFLLYIRIQPSYDAQNLVFKPMIRPADTSPEFEPYYLTNHEDIYIGASPLTEGQTVSNTQDIEVFEGENTIDTTLYNKPVMEIEYE